MNLWIVTGRRGSGKTTFCRGMLQEARQSGWQAAGILSPAGFQDGIKTSIYTEDIRSGQKRLLASTCSQKGMDLSFGDWFFDRQVLSWGDGVLRSSVPCDLLVIDELGPLEFEMSLGFVSAWELIRTAQFHLALVVVRFELLKRAQQAFRSDQTIQIDQLDMVADQVIHYSSRMPRLKDAT